jgi:hypothetical protein
MGLDMYLMKRQKGSNSHEDEAEVAYWRKANQIRGWFGEKVGVANCEYSAVTKELLEELVRDCKEVLQDHDLAGRILPTQSGFFFGSTEYDEWYFDDLERTIEMVSRVIEETDWETEEVAYFEWW